MDSRMQISTHALTSTKNPGSCGRTRRRSVSASTSAALACT